MVVSMQKGGGSKDTWVLSLGTRQHFQSAAGPTVNPVELSRGGSDLPSRAADNLFWLGRYAERAEGTGSACSAASWSGSTEKIGHRRRPGTAVLASP